jgi:hypothetical protein
MHAREKLTALVSAALVLAVFSLRCGDGGADATDAGADGNVVGQLDGGVSTKLPPLPPLVNVVATQADDSVNVTFDPWEGALDYRIYPLPKDEDVTVAGDGQFTIENATYRCAGRREAPAPDVDTTQGESWVKTFVDGQSVGGFKRTLADATLGWVYAEPGPGRVPVYAIGDGNENADNSCYFARWAASRTKKYVTSEETRKALLAAGGRDDGIVFYVPEKADGTTTMVQTAEDGDGSKTLTRYYWTAGAESAARTKKSDAFPVLTASAPGATPLMRVFYANNCGFSHDELVAGKERFTRAWKQGDDGSAWSVHWSGIKEPTTLVVEALDAGCPFQGFLSPKAFAGQTVKFGNDDIVHQPFSTLDQLRAAAPHGQVFVNGHWDPKNVPRAVARSFIKVQPVPHEKMDFYADFHHGAETFTDVECGSPDKNCYQTWRQQSPSFDQIFMNAESAPGGSANGGLAAAGVMFGQLWVTYADVAADTNGRYRLTARKKAEMKPDAFLHVTMTVDMYSTGRRYPQILISDRDAPVQYTLAQGHTLVVQPRSEMFGGQKAVDFPVDYELQVCNLKNWDVNDQCPLFDLHRVKDKNGTVKLAPNDELGEIASADRPVRFDVWTSTKRTYLYLDGKPYACADLPAAGPPNGPVTVTWGDVLYHSSVDHTYKFHAEHMQVETRRHFDDLGFSSNVTAPAWDEARLPCVTTLQP